MNLGERVAADRRDCQAGSNQVAIDEIDARILPGKARETYASAGRTDPLNTNARVSTKPGRVAYREPRTERSA